MFIPENIYLQVVLVFFGVVIVIRIVRWILSIIGGL